MLANYHAAHHADTDKGEKNEKLNTEISYLQRHGAAGPSGLSVLQRPRPCPWERCDRKQHSIHCRPRNCAWFQFWNHFPTHLCFQSCCRRASVTTAGASRAGFYKRSGRLSTSWISYAIVNAVIFAIGFDVVRDALFWRLDSDGQVPFSRSGRVVTEAHEYERATSIEYQHSHYEPSGPLFRPSVARDQRRLEGQQRCTG